MLTIEEFIEQKKKKDKLDEFNFKNHAENMSAIIQYVMEYFNDYLNPETYDYEKVKAEQAIEKIKNEIAGKYPKSIDAIISFYKENKQRLDRLLDKSMRQIDDVDLFYSEEDFKNVASYFCTGKLGANSEGDFFKDLTVLAKELKFEMSSPPSLSDMKELDNAIVDWVKETYRNYKVNLYEFAQSVISEFSEKYIDSVYDRSTEIHYYINSYDYRYQDNPFDINDIYECNKHRPFILDRKGELEMLIMHAWLFEEVKDLDYWAEYVNLCISTGRVKLARNINVLIPVSINGLQYTADIPNDVSYVETSNGSIRSEPVSQYILRLNHKDGYDTIWTDKNEMNSIIDNLHSTFKKYGAPVILEFLSPYRNSQYNENTFFEYYTLFEKSMQRYHKMKIAIVNGPLSGKKNQEYLVATIEDIKNIRSISKELKCNLKLSIDFTDSIKRNTLKSDGVFECLSSMRSFVIGIHLNSIDSGGQIRKVYNSENGEYQRRYINKHDYYNISDFLAGLSMFMRDSKPRYFIPEKVKSSEQLENLVDMLLRGGFCFNSQEASHG